MAEPEENFSIKLNRLFEQQHKPGGKKYTQTEVIEGTKGVLTRVYLSKLRKGHATNPGYHVIQAIADFFGVDPSYFFEDEGQLILYPKTNDRLVNRIKQRVALLDEDGKKLILELIDYILKIK